MTQDDLSPLFAQYPEVIAQMDRVFSSHQFILALARQHQGLYIDALHSYGGAPDPFRTVHAMLAKHLTQYPTLVRYVRQAPSTDIFGQRGHCAEWERLD